jgi:uncharacterized RDD family membrane protein YckC
MPELTGVTGNAGVATAASPNARWTPSPAAQLARDVEIADTRESAYANRRWSGFWRRVAASWIDGFILQIATYVILVPAGVFSAMARGRPASPFSFFGWFWLGYLATFVLYHAIFLSTNKGSTPGRMAAGIAVLNADTGSQPGFGRAVLREVIAWISALTVLPNLVQLVTDRRQSVSDLLAKTVVVSYRKSSAAIVIVVVLLFGTAMIGILAAIAIPQYQHYMQRAKQAAAPPDAATHAIDAQR